MTIGVAFNFWKIVVNRKATSWNSAPRGSYLKRI